MTLSLINAIKHENINYIWYHELCLNFVKYPFVLNFGNLIEFAMNFVNYSWNNTI
jgi:hypothetical protein